MKININYLLQKKNNKEKITMLTAYEHSFARLIDAQGIDIVLIGDSLGNVFSGFENTLPVTLEHMIYHTQAVKKGVKNALIVADLPFLSYQISSQEAKISAGRLIKEGGAEAVKAEVNPAQIDYIKEIIDMGIPVMGHIGFTPQSIHQFGGYKIQGNSIKDAQTLVDLAKNLEKIGVFAIVLEMVPAKIAKKITKSLSIPTIGIGAGPDCDGQVLVTHDLLGFSGKFKPKFVKQYTQLENTIKDAFTAFKQDVENNRFPSDEHSY